MNDLHFQNLEETLNRCILVSLSLTDFRRFHLAAYRAHHAVFSQPFLVVSGGVQADAVGMISAARQWTTAFVRHVQNG
jgi:hypothetical protein